MKFEVAVRFPVNVPKMDDTTETVLIVEWVVELNALVSEGDSLVTVEGDKASFDVPSPVTGQLVEQLAEVDSEVDVGATIAAIEG